MAQLYAGASRIRITSDDAPVRDPLYAKVLVLKSGERTAAIVSLDYVSMGGGISELSDDFFPALKSRMEALSVASLICGVTHTHTPMPMHVEEDQVLERVCSAIAQARDAAEPVRIGFGQGRDSSFLINRTLTLQDGSAWTIRQAHPCPPDEQIAAVELADPAIEILRVDRTDGSPLCVLFTFGCHPLLGYASNKVTANYPGIAERIVEAQTGAVAMMLQSCGGDVTEISYKDYHTPKCCDGPGMSLGLAVLQALKSIRTEEVDGFAFVRREAVFPRRDDIPAVRARLLAEREELLESLSNCPLNFKAFLPLYMKYLMDPKYPLDHAYAYLWEEERGITQRKDQDAINRKNLQKYLDNLQTMEKLSKLTDTLQTLKWHEDYNAASGELTAAAEVAALQLGEKILLTAPVEPLSAIGRQIKALSPNIMLIGYANGYLHYGAPAEAYNNGGYETIECMLGAGWQAVYEAAVGELLAQLGKT